MNLPREADAVGPLPAQDGVATRRVILLLAASVALMMTGFGIIFPVFGKRLGELGGGVQALGLMSMAFAAAQFLLAPFLGSLADRVGRRPIVLVSLGGFAVANVAFLLVDSAGGYVAVRFFEGAITAGLLPAAMAVVADTVEEEERARWTGIVMGSYGLGIIVGPALGGLRYEGGGFAAPFAVSAGLGALALLLAAALVPETRVPSPELRAPRGSSSELGTRRSDRPSGMLGSLPRPLTVFGTLLLLDFLAVFIFAFVEPQLVFFVYDDLGFSATQFGVIIGGYGLAMALGQAALGGLSDRFGRTPLIAVGFLLNVAFYLGLVVTREFVPLLLVAVVAGLGTALLEPALSAFYLDVAGRAHRGRVMGFKESAAAFGGVTGPLAVALVSGWLGPLGVFAVAAALPALAAALALAVLTGRGRRAATPVTP